MFTGDWRGKGGLVEALFQSSGDALAECAIPRDDESVSCTHARRRCVCESALTQEAESIDGCTHATRCARALSADETYAGIRVNASDE